MLPMHGDDDDDNNNADQRAESAVPHVSVNNSAASGVSIDICTHGAGKGGSMGGPYGGWGSELFLSYSV